MEERAGCCKCAKWETCVKILSFLAHRIRIIDILPWDRKLYLTQAISPRLSREGYKHWLFIFALWSPAGKGLTSWLSFVVSNCEFVTFPLVSRVRCGT